VHFIKSFYLNSLVALAYFLGGVIGSLLALEPSNSSPVWPAAGIALAVVLIYGRRILPGLFVGVFGTQLYISFGADSVTTASFILTLIKAIASCLQAMVGAMLIRHFVGKQDVLLDLSEVLRFFLYGALLSSLVAPTICISVFYLQNILSAGDFFFAWLTWWVGDAVGVFIFTPIVLAFFAQPEAIWRPRRFTVALPLSLLLLCLVFVFFYSQQQEKERINRLFEHRVERVQHILEGEVNTYKNIAENMVGIFNASEGVTAAEFRVMARSILKQHPGLIAIEWIPRTIEYSELGERKVRFPIQYVEPYEPNKRVIGFDITQNTVALKTLNKAINTGKALSTGLIHLFQDSEHYRVVSVVYAPVYQKNMPTENVTVKADYILGIVAVVFTIEDLRTNTLSALVDNQLRIKITSNDELFYSNFSDQRLAPISFVSLQTSKTMHSAGNTWQVTYRPSEQFFSNQITWHVWWVMLGGFFFTCFATVGLLVLTGRTAHITEQVKLKTRDLTHVNQQLKAESILRQQLELEQLTRNRVLERLAKGEACADILAEVILGAEKLYPESLCSILLLDESGKHLTQGAANNLPDFYNKAINGLAIGQGVGSCGTAAYTGQRVIVEDIMTHPYWMAFIDLAKRAGLYACWSEPILSSKGQVLGTFAIYYREAKKPDQRGLDFIKRMADLTAITTERKQAEDELRIAATTFQSHDAVVITDVQGTVMRVNQAYTNITGYSAAEVIGKNSSLLSSGRHDKDFFRDMFASLTEKGLWEGEIWNRRKGGDIYPERMIITAVYNGEEISHYVGIFSDISEKKASEEEIERLAFYDPLTGLPNRRLLLDRLEQAVISTKRHNNFGAVIYMDLDYFKSLNDTLGHQIGDELLIQVAQRLEGAIRTEDTACRLGGDEFVVLIISRSDTSLNEMIEHAALIAEKIRNKINQPFELSGGMRSFSTSIGVSVFPDKAILPEEILEQADTAMYRSKHMGRNKVSFFSAQMQEEHNRKSSLERMLHSALSEQQFVVYYQGQTNSDGKMLSAEALLRWIHPEQGMVSPAEFIPVAEGSDLIVEIGSWVLHEVCRQIKVWQNTGFYLDHVAVNISPRQFRQDNFVQQVAAAIADSGIDAKYLMVELTEGIVIEDIQVTIDKMLQLQAMGIAISIDDFGTGYSSLAYLKELPLSQLKIDQSFVRDINVDASDEVIVEAIIALAHKLGLEVIAEGVETKEQMQFLYEKGCERYQGYYFYRPMPAEELVQ